MKAYYDNQPSKLQAVGNGSYLYRWNIRQEERPTQGNSATNEEEQAEAEQPTTTQWVCNEVVVWGIPTANSITQAAIAECWDSDYEQKLVNEYNAAKLGLIGGSASSPEAKEKINAYKAFLTERAALKAQIDSDIEELQVNNN